MMVQFCRVQKLILGAKMSILGIGACAPQRLLQLHPARVAASVCVGGRLK